jgi:hypothetical protein
MTESGQTEAPAPTRRSLRGQVAGLVADALLVLMWVLLFAEQGGKSVGVALCSTMALASVAKVYEYWHGELGRSRSFRFVSAFVALGLAAGFILLVYRKGYFERP